MERGERDQLVAVHHGTVAIDGEHAVAVAVESEPPVVAALLDGRSQPLDVRRADAVVDVAAVRLRCERIDVRAKPAEDLRRHAVGRPVRAVQQDPLATEVEIGEADLELAEVVAARTVQLAHAAVGGLALLRVDQTLDLAFLLVRELRPVRSEELDPVVAIGVVRGGDDHREVEPEAPHQQCCAGRRQDPGEQRVAAGRRDARRERRLEHLAGLARVADDQYLRGPDGRHRGRRAAERKRELGRQELARHPAHAIRSEQLWRMAHRTTSPPRRYCG